MATLEMAIVLLLTTACGGVVPAAAKALITRKEDLPKRTGEPAELHNGTFRFTDVDVFYHMLDSGDTNDPVILFLHGRSFTSDIWVQIGSLRNAWENRYKAVAIDLPGFGATRHLPYVDNNMRAEFIKAALDFALQGRNLTAVLVVPSMSGKWAIPFLDRYGQMLGGVLMLAPVGVNSWGGPWEFTHKQVQLLALYGDRDPMKADADNLNKLFLHAQQYIIKDAGHACYVDKPDAFHMYLQKFLQHINPLVRIQDPFKKQGE